MKQTSLRKISFVTRKGKKVSSLLLEGKILSNNKLNINNKIAIFPIKDGIAIKNIDNLVKVVSKL